MDADVEYKLSRYGRRVRQLVLIPDADVSDADTESDDDTTIGTSRHEVSSDDGSDWSTEDEEVPLAKLKPIHSDDDDDGLPLAQVQQQKSEDCQTKTEIANSRKKRPTFRWRNMSQPVFDTTWKDLSLIHI